jgi:hypothetical protein
VKCGSSHFDIYKCGICHFKLIRCKFKYLPYFESSHALKFAGFGKILGKASLIFQNYEIGSLETNGPWTNNFYSALNIFSRTAKNHFTINPDLSIEQQLTNF